MATRKFQFHFVDYDRENRTYYTKPADNCDPVAVGEDRRFWNEDEVQNQIEALELEGFDDPVLCITISDDDDFEIGGMFRIFINYGAFSGMNFVTEDLRPHVRLPEGVSTDDVFFCLFTNGNEEDSILQWAVFCPFED